MSSFNSDGFILPFAISAIMRQSASSISINQSLTILGVIVFVLLIVLLLSCVPPPSLRYT